MRFLGRKSSSSGPKAICWRILNKFIPSTVRRSRYGRSEDGEWLAIPTKVSAVGGAHYRLYVLLCTCMHMYNNNKIIIIHARTHTTQLIKLEDVATSNHMSLVELATIIVKNRQSKKCRTTLMISDTGVELLHNKQVSPGHTWY